MQIKNAAYFPNFRKFCDAKKKPDILYLLSMCTLHAKRELLHVCIVIVKFTKHV